MVKRLLATALLISLPSVAVAGPNVGGCGLGSKLMAGNQGIAPQVLAVTTNGTSGNQTFGITTGTLGCTQDGVVRTNWKVAKFIDSNMNKLARDMSVGDGESLDSLASLLGMTEGEKSAFAQVAQKNFGRIFPSTAVTTSEVQASLRAVVGSDAELAAYADMI
jgi:hypothetical protein